MRSTALALAGERRQRAERVPVVVEVEADGFFRVFAPKNVDVRVVNRLEATSADTATLVDQYHHLQVPAPHQKVYWPCFVRACGLPRRTTAEDELDRRWRLEWVRACNEASRAMGGQR